ncbi:hypothetical protein ABT063_24610 [Streptomyces sp. NPDC002838]|uniref:hypothetical protein n=1 Tax=Streptomyces sp. NPDC002838 TaxID=3154436 RepID=UPI00332F2182
MKLTTRHLVRGKGRHRAVVVPERIEVPLDDLLGTPWPEPRPPYGAAVTQTWQDCKPCDKATAGVVHKDGWTCGECLITTPAEGDA